MVAVTRRSGEFLQHDFLHDVGKLLDFLGRADALDHVDFDERHVVGSGQAEVVICQGRSMLREND